MEEIAGGLTRDKKPKKVGRPQFRDKTMSRVAGCEMFSSRPKCWYLMLPIREVEWILSP